MIKEAFGCSSIRNPGNSGNPLPTTSRKLHDQLENVFTLLKKCSHPAGEATHPGFQGIGQHAKSFAVEWLGKTALVLLEGIAQPHIEVLQTTGKITSRLSARLEPSFISFGYAV